MHTLVQDDCMNWLRDANPCSIHAVVTDPPFGMIEFSQIELDQLRRGRGGIWRQPPSFDGYTRAPLPRFTALNAKDIANIESFYKEWARLLRPLLVPGAHILLACNSLFSHHIASALSSNGLEKRGEIVRLVSTLRGGDRPKNAHIEFPDVSVIPRAMFEPWLLFRAPIEGRIQDNLRRWRVGALRRPERTSPFGDVIQSSVAPRIERTIAPHPNLKPQKFMRHIVRAVLPFGEGVVLDPFAGSGSTLAAAEANGYDSFGIERDPQYFAMAQQAIPKLCKLKVAAH